MVKIITEREIRLEHIPMILHTGDIVECSNLGMGVVEEIYVAEPAGVFVVFDCGASTIINTEDIK